MTGQNLPYVSPSLELVALSPEGAAFMAFSVDPIEPGEEF